MPKLLLFIATFLLFQTTFAHHLYEAFYLKEADFAPRAAALKAQFGQHKIIPGELALECLTALSFYPELADEHIEFRWDNSIASTMKMMPTIASFLFHKKLKYVVYMNQSAATTNLHINELSFNAKVGWLGHELGHVLQCVRQSRMQTLWMGIRLASKKFMAQFERETDIITIEHQLGYALYEGMYYTFNNPKVSPEYLETLRANYLSLGEILAWIQRVQKQKPS